MCHFLIKFLENLLSNGKNILNKYMHIAFDTVNTPNDTVNTRNDTVFSLIKQNNSITTVEIALKLGKVLQTYKIAQKRL